MLWGVVDSYLIRDSDIIDYKVDIVSRKPGEEHSVMNFRKPYELNKN